jgi:hypothetical protein
MIAPGKRLSFSKEDLDLLGIEICEIIGDLEAQHGRLMEGIRKAWSAYEAEKLVEKKNSPWPGASNVMIPIVMIHANATLARYMTMIKAGENIWAGKSDNEEFVKAGFVNEIPRFLNWAARGHEFDFDTPSTDWMLELIVCGPGVLTCGWETKIVDVIVPGQKDPVPVTVKSGPFVEHIPREYCLWDQNYRAWEAPVFVRKSMLSWSDIVKRVNEDGWDWDVVQEIKGDCVPFTPMDDVKEDKEERSGSDRLMAPSTYGLYDFREVWIDWPMVSKSRGITPPDEMEEGDRLSTIVLFVHRDSGKIVKAVAKPYFHHENPFFDAYFKKRSGINSSSGLGNILFDIQEACSTFVNQSADAVTKSNSTQGATSNPQLAKADLAPNKFVLVDDPGSDVAVFNQGKNIAPDMMLYSQLNVTAERITGISDPAMGRETRMGGHPAPATSTLSLLAEGKKLDLVGIRSIRQAISRLGIYLATLYQQFETSREKVVKAVGAEDGEKIIQWLSPEMPIFGNLELDLAAVSETMNPQVEQQKALAIFQITGNYYALVTQFLQLAGNPQAPEALVASMLQGLTALQESYKKILESGDIDDIKSFILDLDQIGRSLLESREATQRAAQESSAREAQGANGGAQGGFGQAVGSGL